MAHAQELGHPREALDGTVFFLGETAPTSRYARPIRASSAVKRGSWRRPSYRGMDGR